MEKGGDCFLSPSPLRAGSLHSYYAQYDVKPDETTKPASSTSRYLATHAIEKNVRSLPSRIGRLVSRGKGAYCRHFRLSIAECFRAHLGKPARAKITYYVLATSSSYVEKQFLLWSRDVLLWSRDDSSIGITFMHHISHTISP